MKRYLSRKVYENRIQLLLFFVSFVILLQSPCAPFANKVAEYDAGVFIYCAKQLLKGGLIYKDFFDHKGPVLYLINAVGLFLCGGNVIGIFLMELLSLLLTALFLHKTTLLFTSRNISLLSTLYALLLLGALEPGHGTQYYALPLISCSLFLFLRTYKEKEKFFSTRDLVAISFLFTFTLLLQPNLVTLWIAFAFVTSLYLLSNKQYQTLLETMLIVIAAVTVATLPFIVYAIRNDLLSDAIFSYWLFNRSYSDPSLVKTLKGAYYALANIEKGYAGIPIAFYLCHVAWHSGKTRHRLVDYGIVLSLFLTLFLGCALSGLDFPHYAIILLPLVCVITAFCLQYLQDRCSPDRLLLVSVMVALCWRPALTQAKSTFYAFRPNPQLQSLVSFIKKNTGEKDYIAVVGNDSQLYYLSGRKSSSRFHFTSPIFSVKRVGAAMIREYLDDLHRNKPKLIAIKTADNPEAPSYLQDFLALGYRRVNYHDSGVVIYLRNT